MVIRTFTTSRRRKPWHSRPRLCVSQSPHRRGRRCHKRGFILLDMVGGLLIIAALSVALLGVIKQHRVATDQLNAQQRALTLAEQTLIRLQTGQNIESDAPNTQIEIEVLNEGHLLPGKRWVRVRVEHENQAASLVGVTPSGAGGVR